MESDAHCSYIIIFTSLEHLTYNEYRCRNHNMKALSWVLLSTMIKN